MANKPLNTDLLDRTIVFAVKAHAGTERRKGGNDRRRRAGMCDRREQIP